MIIGGMLGSVLGSQMEHGRGSSAATILGTLAGVMIGGAIGRSMDDADRRKTAHVLENVQTGVPGEWVNPDTGYRYRVVPTRTYDSQDGPCREYEVDALIRGRTEKVYGKACRERDGTWRVAD